MVEEITIPSARASILWLLGEYGHRVPKIAPDVLRKMAKSFPKEHVAVKLQVFGVEIFSVIVGAYSLRFLLHLADSQPRSQIVHCKSQTDSPNRSVRLHSG